jgi:hypothetical protein
VSFGEIDLGGGGEPFMDGYYSVKKGDTEVLQLLRPLKEAGPLMVVAVDPLIATADGIKPGDKAAVLGEKRKDVTCTAQRHSPARTLLCTSAAEPSMVFVLDASGFKEKLTDDPKPIALAKVAERKIIQIYR